MFSEFGAVYKYSDLLTYLLTYLLTFTPISDQQSISIYQDYIYNLKASVLTVGLLCHYRRLACALPSVLVFRVSVR